MINREFSRKLPHWCCHLTYNYVRAILQIITSYGVSLIIKNKQIKHVRTPVRLDLIWQVETNYYF